MRVSGKSAPGDVPTEAISFFPTRIMGVSEKDLSTAQAGSEELAASSINTDGKPGLAPVASIGEGQTQEHDLHRTITTRQIHVGASVLVNCLPLLTVSRSLVWGPVLAVDCSLRLVKPLPMEDRPT